MFKSPVKTYLLLLALVGIGALCAYLEDKYSDEPSAVKEEVSIPDAAPAIERIRINTNLWVIMDHTTGCQYIETDVGVTPRMYSDGAQYCIDNINAIAEQAYLEGLEDGEEEEITDSDAY